MQSVSQVTGVPVKLDDTLKVLTLLETAQDSRNYKLENHCDNVLEYGKNHSSWNVVRKQLQANESN